MRRMTEVDTKMKIWKKSITIRIVTNKIIDMINKFWQSTNIIIMMMMMEGGGGDSRDDDKSWYKDEKRKKNNHDNID